MANKGYPDGIVRYPVSVSKQTKNKGSDVKQSASVVELDKDLTLSDVSVEDGSEVTIIYVNKWEGDVSVTVPCSEYATPDGTDIVITVSVGGYGEVSLLRIGNTVFARGC